MLGSSREAERAEQGGCCDTFLPEGKGWTQRELCSCEVKPASKYAIQHYLYHVVRPPKYLGCIKPCT
jgi:hypothetical protein